MHGGFPPPPVPQAALVTGGARRIGRALALALAEAGYAVAVHHHASHAEAEALVAEISRAGGRAVALAADLADEAAVKRLLPRRDGGARADRRAGQQRLDIRERHGRDGDARELGRASRGQSARAVRADPGIRGAAAADAGGVVVNLLDQRVWNLTPYFVSYTVSKTGLWTLTRTMALALAPRIRVNGIGPGPTLPSPRQSRRADSSGNAGKMPLRRGTSPGEIAAALRFILAAPAMTGQMIALDGGQHLGWAQPGQTPQVE